MRPNYGIACVWIFCLGAPEFACYLESVEREEEQHKDVAMETILNEDDSRQLIRGGFAASFYPFDHQLPYALSLRFEYIFDYFCF